MLDDPDAVAPLTQHLADALRAEVIAARRSVADSREAEVSNLAASAEWQKLELADQQAILSGCGLGAIPELLVGDPGALLAALDLNPLADWAEKLAALPGRITRAREQAAKKLQPTAVKVLLRGATLHNATEADAYLAALRSDIMANIDAGNPVIL